jgi:hypothetical protein
VQTSELIQQLAAKPTPVRRLAPPWRRAIVWLALSTVYAAVVAFGQPLAMDDWRFETRFMIEQGATLATAITAAVAAFWSVVPGADRRWLLLPLLPLGVWLAALGQGCVQDWLKLGSDGFEFGTDWDCVWLAALFGIPPTIAIVFMLRQGAPLLPRATLMLAAVAVAAFANFAVTLYHYNDISFIILIWHFGLVVVLSAIAGVVGPKVLKWRRIKPA